jgi:hypothetical protein
MEFAQHLPSTHAINFGASTKLPTLLVAIILCQGNNNNYSLPKKTKSLHIFGTIQDTQ